MNSKVLLPHFKKDDGLVTVVVQDKNTREVLRVGYVDEVCYLETLKTGAAVFYSKSRRRCWKQGEFSGNIMRVKKILIDCSGHTLLYEVIMENGSYAYPHTWASKTNCFFQNVICPPSEESGSFRVVTEVCEQIAS